jgi:hypothetical protein
MADNVTLNPGIGGANIASDEIAGAQYQRIKLIHGDDGTNDGDVSNSNPLPVDLKTSVDFYTGAIQIIDWEHSRIHDGKGYVVNGKHQIANNATTRFLLRNGAGNYPHLRTIFITSDSGPLEIYFHEAPTVTTTGSSVPVISYNRNSLNTSLMTAFSGATVSNEGTLLEYMVVPGTGSTGGSASVAQTEFILKPSTDYMVRIFSSATGTTNYSLKLFWYEN